MNVEDRPVTVDTTSAAPTMAPSASESTLLAVDRTRLAHERTLMAWIRTAASMISFGFTIFKFFEGQPTRPRRFNVVSLLLNSRNFATILIVVALISLLFAAIDSHREMSALRARYPGHVPRSNALTVAILVAGFGLFALAAVLFGGP